MTGDGGTTRWVLGFDNGCVTCSGLARQIEELSDRRLIARSLRELQVQQWRTQALGAGAPWLPTLFEVTDEKVRAWQGQRMAWQLSKLLGPRKMWQIAQLLGEIPVALQAAPDPARRRFLKTLGGVVLGVSVLSGTKALTPLAAIAAETESPQVTSLGPAELQALIAQIRSDRDGALLWNSLLNEGYSARLDQAQGSAITRSDASGKQQQFKLQVPFQAADGRTAELGSLLDGKKMQSGISVPVGDKSQVAKIEIRQVANGKVKHTHTIVEQGGTISILDATGRPTTILQPGIAPADDAFNTCTLVVGIICSIISQFPWLGCGAICAGTLLLTTLVGMTICIILCGFVVAIGCWAGSVHICIAAGYNPY